jgi:hypothetical protein
MGSIIWIIIPLLSLITHTHKNIPYLSCDPATASTSLSPL